MLGGIAGFHAYYMVRTEGGGAIAVSVYDDRDGAGDGAEESSSAAASWIRENAPDLEISAPQVSGGDVSVSS